MFGGRNSQRSYAEGGSSIDVRMEKNKTPTKKRIEPYPLDPALMEKLGLKTDRLVSAVVSNVA